MQRALAVLQKNCIINFQIFNIYASAFTSRCPNKTGTIIWHMINKPIFILGSGRSGTTLLYNLLAAHPQVCWFSILTDTYYRWPQLSAFHRLLDFPIIGQTLKRRIIALYRNTYSLYPAEGEHIYYTLCHFENSTSKIAEFSRPAKTALLKKHIEIHLRHTGKRRFINKQTANTQRINLMHKLFPDAYWIHIIRDGRAVANSLCRVSWWPITKLWWLGKTPKEWNPDGTKWLELGARHWRHNIMEIRSHATLLQPKYMEIRYEDLVMKPRDTIKAITRFTQLSEEREYIESLPKSLKNYNTKWRTTLSKNDKALLNKLIGKQLKILGYEI